MYSKVSSVLFYVMADLEVPDFPSIAQIRPKVAAKLAKDIGEDLLTPDQHQMLMEGKYGDPISHLLSANLGDPLCPDLQVVMDKLGGPRPVDVPNVIMSLRFFSAAAMMRVIEDANHALKAKPSTKERLEALRLRREAVMEFGKMVNQIQTLAIRVNRIPKELELVVAPVVELPKKIILGIAPDLE